MTTSAQLGGDGLGYHWIDSERFAFYLLPSFWSRCEVRIVGSSIIDTLRTCGLADIDWKRSPVRSAARVLNRVYFFAIACITLIHDLVRIADLGTRNITFMRLARWGPSLPQFLRAAGMQESEVSRRAVRQSVASVMLIYPTLEVPLPLSDGIVSLSDGVFETRRQQETASLDRLVDFLVGPRMAMARLSPRFAIAPSSTLNAHRPPTIVQYLKVSLC